MPKPFIKGKFANHADLPEVLPVSNVGNEFNYRDGLPEITSLDKSQGGMPLERGNFNAALQLLSKFAVSLQGGEFTIPTFDTRMTQPPMAGYNTDSVLWYKDTQGGVYRILQSNKNNNTDDFTQNPSHIGVSWVQLGIVPFALSSLYPPALSTGQVLLGLYNKLPSASYIWGDAGRQELRNVSTSYAALKKSIIDGLLPYGTIDEWQTQFTTHPDNVVPFWGYDPTNDIILPPNISRGYALTSSGGAAAMGTVLQNASPDIIGEQLSVIVGGSNSGNTKASGAFKKTTYSGGYSASGGSGANMGGNDLKFNASDENPAYGRDNTDRVRNDQVQMRVMFYIGAEMAPQEASQIIAANVLAQIAELESRIGFVPTDTKINHVDEWGNLCAIYRKDTYTNGETEIWAFGNGWEYHIDRSGCIEQGGLDETTGTGDISIKLLVPMASDKYRAQITNVSNNNTNYPMKIRTASTATTLVVYSGGANTGREWWVRGKIA